MNARVPIHDFDSGPWPLPQAGLQPMAPRVLLTDPEPATELLTWNEAASAKPDSDITVVLWGPDGYFCGWWDDEQGEWLDASSGGQAEGVTHWAEPQGPNVRGVAPAAHRTTK